MIRNALFLRDDSHCPSWCPSVTSRPFGFFSGFSHVHVFELPPTLSTPLFCKNQMTIEPVSELIFDFYVEVSAALVGTPCSVTSRNIAVNIPGQLTSGGGISTSNRLFQSLKLSLTSQIVFSRRSGHPSRTFPWPLLESVRSTLAFLIAFSRDPSTASLVVTATAGLLPVLMSVLVLLQSSMFIQDSAAVSVL